MTWGHILADGQGLLPDNVGLARCAIAPEILKGTFENAFDSSGLFYFRKCKKTGELQLSVGARDILLTENEVHEYGCRVAAVSNANKAERGKDVIPMETAAHYLGYYEVLTGAAKEAANDVYDVTAYRFEEHGEPAHSHIALNERPNRKKILQRLRP
jgi:hypothetical protein